MSKLYNEYEINSPNLDLIINKLQKQGIELENAKKLAPKRLRVCIKFNQIEKFFAIMQELCYTDNVKIKTAGVLYPLYYLYKNVGLVIGALLFIFSTIYFNGFIYKIEYTGSGSILQTQVEECLISNGVTTFSRPSKAQIQALDEKILASTDRLSFVSCYKQGNRLYVNLVLSQEKVDLVKGNAEYFLSPADGVVEKVKVYKGSLAVSIGQVVKQGDLLIDGYVLQKEQRIFTGVLGFVTITSTSIFEYESKSPIDKKALFAFAEQELSGEIVDQQLQSKQIANGLYKYKVKTIYRRTFYAE